MDFLNKFNLKYKDIELDNGLKIKFIKKDGFVKKGCFLTVKFGSNHHRVLYKGKKINIKTGIAHAIEHKIYEVNSIDQFVELTKMGCDANAYTTSNNTMYYFTTTNDIIKPLILTLDFIFNHKFDDSSVKREIPIIIEEKYKRQSDIYYDYDYKLLEMLYKKEPLENTPLGHIRDIKSLTSSDLQIAYDIFYKPINMELLVVGELDFDQVLEKIKSYFSNFKFDLEKATIISKERNYKNKKVILKNRNIEINKGQIGFKILNPTIKDYYIFQALFYYMYSTSCYPREYMIKNNLINNTLDASVFYEKNFLYGIISIEDNNPEVMISNILKCLNNFDINEIDEEDLECFKKYYLGGIYLLCDNYLSLAENISANFSSEYDFFKVLDLINTISIDDIKKAFLKYKNSNKIKIFMKKH